MNLTLSFIKDAMRTNNENAGTYGTIVERQVIHALMGMMDETYELLFGTDSVNMVEELGDFRWFLALYEHATDTNLKLSEYGPALDDVDRMLSRMITITKRIYAYGEPWTKHRAELEKMLPVLHATLCKVATTPNRTFQQTVEVADVAVINKLRARFPAKFTEHHASNRDISYEREVLQQSVIEPPIRTTGVNEMRDVFTCSDSSYSNSSSDSGYSGGSCGSFD